MMDTPVYENTTAAAGDVEPTTGPRNAAAVNAADPDAPKQMADLAAPAADRAVATLHRQSPVMSVREFLKWLAENGEGFDNEMKVSVMGSAPQGVTEIFSDENGDIVLSFDADIKMADGRPASSN